MSEIFVKRNFDSDKWVLCTRFPIKSKDYDFGITLFLLGTYHPLHEDERGLDGGRFIQYSNRVFDYSIEIDISGNLEAVETKFASVVNWISENATGKWNSNISNFAMIGKATLCVNFEMIEDAMMFRLSFV